jgi:hypothetical protein
MGRPAVGVERLKFQHLIHPLLVGPPR